MMMMMTVTTMMIMLMAIDDDMTAIAAINKRQKPVEVIGITQREKPILIS